MFCASQNTLGEVQEMEKPSSLMSFFYMLSLCVRLPHSALLICFIQVTGIEKRDILILKNKVAISKPSIMTKSCIRHQVVLAAVEKHEPGACADVNSNHAGR